MYPQPLRPFYERYANLSLNSDMERRWLNRVWVELHTQRNLIQKNNEYQADRYISELENKRFQILAEWKNMRDHALEVADRMRKQTKALSNEALETVVEHQQFFRNVKGLASPVLTAVTGLIEQRDFSPTQLAAAAPMVVQAFSQNVQNQIRDLYSTAAKAADKVSAVGSILMTKS
jgi:hypothetical protein